jgi:hypothetical protein
VSVPHVHPDVVDEVNSDHSINGACQSRPHDHPSPDAQPEPQPRPLALVFASSLVGGLVTPDDVRVLQGVLSPICAPLHQHLSAALDSAASHFEDFDMADAEYRPVMHHLARAHALKRLRAAEKKNALGGWTVGPKGPNARLMLIGGQVSLRMLRPDGGPGVSTPPPGPNYARRAYYGQGELLGVEASQLIGVWFRDEAGALAIRVVRPVSTWRSGSIEKVDIDFMLPSNGAALEALKFEPNDDGIFLDLPFYNKEEEGNGLVVVR